MELIDRQALLLQNELAKNRSPVFRSYAKVLIDNAPTVDAAPVVHGRWTSHDIIAKSAGYGVRYYRHAECNVNPCRLVEAMFDFCPFCGDKMDGGATDAS